MVGRFQTPTLEQCFGTQYHGTKIVSAFTYDISNAMLYTIYPTINFDIFLQVPVTQAQVFAVADAQLGGPGRNYNIPYPDDVYTTQIAGRYRQCLLLENGAPLLCENGDYLTVN